MSDTLEREPAVESSADLACPCGSGLRQPNCCGLDLAKVERTPAEGLLAQQVGAMSQAYHRGQRDLARRIAIEVLDEAPGQREALGALYNLLKEDGKLDAAGIVIDRVAQLYPNDANTRAIAAQYFVGRGDRPRAQFHSRMLVRLAPMAALAHFVMGRTFLGSNNAVAAEHHFRLALQLGEPDQDPAPAEVEAHLAIALRDQGRLGEARAIFARIDERALSVAVLLAWAGLEEADRRFDAAAALLDRAEALAPGGPRIAMARAGLHRRANAPEAALETLEAMTADASEAVGRMLQKGQVLDSLGRYDEAFAAFSAYKQALRERGGQTYHAERAAHLVTGLREFFTEGRYPLLPRAETRAGIAQPIFIVGFPRSGTTLVEQTLTSHPQIAAGDELPIVNGIADRSQALLGSPGQYPLSLSEFWLGDRVGHVGMLRDLYLSEAARIGALDPAKRWFTDKMPLNETHLGLISLMFPQSPIVHLVRHPLDVVLSVFSNGLTHGYNCASALETAAQHYALIAELIEHYRAVLPIRYHALRYEDLVADQESEVRRLFDFIGEDYDPRALDFHDNLRPARTASHAQVTEKLYTRSRYRYRRYRKHLEPVIPILAPAIARLGYAIED